MSIKLLTGQILHEAFNETSKWQEMSQTPLGQRMQKRYNEIAKSLNQDLGLCEECGERPVAPNMMHEVAGDEICSNCINPPIDPTDTKVQVMHFVFNEDNTLAGAITPPAGMDLEDYRKQLQDEMKDVHFILDDIDNTEYPAKTLSELAQLFKQHVPIWDADHTYAYYQIRVFKGSKDIGRGWYRRRENGVEIVGESDAGEGLMDTLEEYARMEA
jgi:hypothetical protein